MTFLLLGLVALEYGCNDNESTQVGCDSNTHHGVVGISNLNMYDYQNSVYDYLTSGDSVSYNHFVVNTVPKIEFIGGIEQSSNSGAYAIMVPMYPVCWRLNSIQIIGLGNGATEDLTDKFLVHIRNGENNPFEITNDQAFRNRFTQEFVSTYSRLEFKLKEVPAIRTEQVLKFIFTNQDGSTWTLDTDPIVITP